MHENYLHFVPFGKAKKVKVLYYIIRTYIDLLDKQSSLLISELAEYSW